MLLVRCFNQISIRVIESQLGKVPHHAKAMPTELVDIGNGGEAPEWGIEMELHGGPSTITYGPWTDRQRYVLFFERSMVLS
jgi:hypothetical protein